MPAKSINLLPRTDFDQTPLGRFLRWSLTYGRYIIVCTEIVVLLAFIYRFSLDRKITDLNEEIEQKSAIIEANQEFEHQFRQLQERVELINSYASTQNISISLLTHLESITPEGIKLTSYSYAQNKLVLNANALSNTHLAVFLHNLKMSEYLANINVTSISKKTSGVSETAFQVEAGIKPQSLL